jgi:hypothetical protein
MADRKLHWLPSTAEAWVATGYALLVLTTVVFYLFTLVVHDPADGSNFGGVYAFVVTLPWSLLLQITSAAPTS